VSPPPDAKPRGVVGNVGGQHGEKYTVDFPLLDNDEQTAKF